MFITETLSTTMCHMQTSWELYQFTEGALLEILTGMVWVEGLPFPFSRAVVLPRWQGRQAAVSAPKVSAPFNPLVVWGMIHSLPQLHADLPLNPTDSRVMADFCELALWKRLWKLLYAAMCLLVVAGEHAEKISVQPICGAFSHGYELRVKYLLFVKMWC